MTAESSEWPERSNRRIWRRTFWIVGIALVCGGVFGALSTHHHQGLLLGTVATMLTFGGLAGTFSLFPISAGRIDELRLSLLGIDRSRRRAIRRAVLGRRDGEPARLSPEERRRGFDYARAFSVNQPVVLAQSLLLFVGLIGTQLVANADLGSFWGWVRLVYLTVIPVFLVALTIVNLVRIRRAAAFVQEEANDW